MQRHFAEVVGSAGNAAGRGWQETWQKTDWQSWQQEAAKTLVFAQPRLYPRDRSRTPLNQSSQQDQEQRFPHRPNGGGRNVASVQCMRFPELGRLQNIIPEGIRNWNGRAIRLSACCQWVCATSSCKRPPLQEEELEQEVRSLVLCTDGSASMSSGWPKEP